MAEAMEYQPYNEQGIPSDQKYCRLAHYDVENAKKIGKGQFSEVWKARCRIDDQIVALKKVQVRCLCKS